MREFYRYLSNILYKTLSSIMSNGVKSFDILATSLSVLHNYFNLIKIFKLKILLNF